MIDRLTRGTLLALPLVAPALLGACTSSSDHDAVVARNRQLEQQVAALERQVADDKTQIDRLTNAIKYTVNSDLLFPSGGWQLTPEGQRIIARMASQLAPTQQRKVVVNGFTDNTPIGPSLQRAGIRSNEELSQKRAENVRDYMISQGVNPDLVTAHGFGDANPVGSNDTPQGRAQNRRVEMTLAPGSETGYGSAR